MIMYIVFSLALSLALCMVVHEGGHYAAARWFGRRLVFRFAWGRFYVPRFVWNMPDLEYRKQRIIALAGFAAEALVAALLASFGFPWMAVCFFAHLAAYPFYSDERYNDLKWL